MIFALIATCGLCYFLGIFTANHFTYLDYADGYSNGYKQGYTNGYDDGYNCDDYNEEE
ncbi:MAG: hypothetical protein KBT34_10060 [Prevotella sp.]|nr:hypothetical protein [Candidatus Prevotella equi]